MLGNMLSDRVGTMLSDRVGTSFYEMSNLPPAQSYVISRLCHCVRGKQNPRQTHIRKDL